MNAGSCQEVLLRDFLFLIGFINLIYFSQGGKKKAAADSDEGPAAKKKR